MRCIRRAALTALITIGLAASAAAQGNVTQADIQRLQDNVYQAGTDVTQARTRDAARANQLQAELDDLRDEVDRHPQSEAAQGRFARPQRVR